MEVQEFLQLNPLAQLRFAESLGDSVPPEVVALVIHTCLNTLVRSDEARAVYLERIAALVQKTDVAKLIVLAWRFVNTSKAGSGLLETHQHMGSLLADALNTIGLSISYIRRSVLGGEKVFFVGTLGRPIIGTNQRELADQGTIEDDGVLYDQAAVMWRKGRRYVDFIRVPLDETDLPKTLGNLPT